MFIPIWVLHAIVTIIFLVVLLKWAGSTNGTWDFSPVFKVPMTLLGYAIYWIIVLVIKVLQK